jgi:elongation factor P hydroxylase
MPHQAADIIALFEATFRAAYDTCLVAGGEEPLYRPAGSPDEPHRIVFRHDWFASALHEIAHWCVAGPQRRTRVDYGYWYEPDGRTRAQQARFESVEVRPQAVECVLAAACGFPFRVSVDNLGGGEPLDEASFRQAVRKEALRCLREDALPPRAAQLGAVLAGHYGRPWPVPDAEINRLLAD